MKSVVLSSVLPLVTVITAVVGIAGAASAAEPDKQFFQSAEGKWIGPGEIVAGKYKGTKFNCSFTGSTPDGKVGMSLDGGCRVGMFTQPMSAKIERKGREGYKGSFMGGATGSGLDIIGGNVVDARKVVFTINRNQLRGVMQARIPDDNSMTVTIAVRVDDQLVPVIGMSLKRVDAVEVGSIAPN
ncbi:hypothetical protein [Mesorhizobium sp. M7A.F.Ca.US.008.03.1.1]|uniref:hypothetical protein n=1 Tax=Mesorhizobium sp. M7A.F.Ca.US.008.03.1.1 TaxID=2496742 RepID=UPI000FCB1317|nr:hypothetical protein [Mesorhizobium sp. M7A.F.Ca.US.008.03.1.1]RUW58291.1 hypothetical protein EOA16_28555 [Mesorhizobium sp. M7A.F.Ca.US.008.03.1.1]